MSEPRRTTPECVRTVLEYEFPAGRASIAFHSLTGRRPTAADCDSANVAAATWDQDGWTPGTAYRLFRWSESELVRVRSWSIDPASAASTELGGFGSSAAGAELVSDPLTPTVGVLASWVCAGSQLRRGAWSYLPCLCHNVLETDRPDRVNDAAAAALAESLQGVIALLAIRRSTVLVALTSQIGGVYVRPCPVSVIQDVRVERTAVVTQRRRLAKRGSARRAG